MRYCKDKDCLNCKHDHCITSDPPLSSNKDYRLTYFNEYYQKNKEKKQEYAKDYYQKNKEHVKAKAKQYYHDNKEKALENMIFNLRQEIESSKTTMLDVERKIFEFETKKGW